jgi:rubrerythrin
MHRVRREYVTAVTAAQNITDLHWTLQAAVELEHSTIPPYLSAAFSLKPSTNDLARDVLISVANEEMLHMTIVSNLLNAVGGRPIIDKPGFIPLYPGQLPMSVDDGLVVGLHKATRALIYEKFMRIEEPEQPLELLSRQARLGDGATRSEAPESPTIGTFYAAIKQKLRELGDGAFSQPSNPQVVDARWFPADELFPITDVDSACRAIDVVVEQGEGTAQTPLGEPGGTPAHYYRFEQIVRGRLLEHHPDATGGFAFTGAPVALDPLGVWNLYPDPKVSDYAPGSRARNLVERFNYSYTALLRALHDAFNGNPDAMTIAFGVMFELRLLADEVVSTPVGETDLTACPTFEYAPLPL